MHRPIKKPKNKSLLKKTNGLEPIGEFIMTYGPHAQEAANYMAHGTAAMELLLWQGLEKTKTLIKNTEAVSNA